MPQFRRDEPPAWSRLAILLIALAGVVVAIVLISVG